MRDRLVCLLVAAIALASVVAQSDAQESEESSIKARGRKGLIAKNQTFLVRDGDSLTVDQDEAALGPQVDG